MNPNLTRPLRYLDLPLSNNFHLDQKVDVSLGGWVGDWGVGPDDRLRELVLRLLLEHRLRPGDERKAVRW